MFLSYASTDRHRVQTLYELLRRDGIEVWLDQNELVAGEKFNTIIKDEINSCRAVVVCISENWLKRAYAQKELAWALERAAMYDDFLFPINLDGCATPRRLKEEGQIYNMQSRNKQAQLRKLIDRLRSTLVRA
ncbi:toll/interleukin-1 receptor domain-containing protein [Bradyrhizobium guangzhouense]|uniref:TIR domain-containing protein n=1 Tax=Bradyrhizobium guangzhouense TaxID=1325095 RepID=A0AAE6CBD9_9BRAD|nr:toll/interleukin-1 receptor domain-containing protein [Bradyrhizobium guangzhouense]QAU49676.1 hypothetical protein XH91_32795 [Bradyrhizobium guangzhouense]